jgi:hypothetical protein
MVRITRRQCHEQSSEPIVQHQQPATSNYQGRQGAVRRATEPLTQLRGSAAHSPALFPVSASGIRALYRVACSKRGPRFLEQHRAKARARVLAIWGALGVQQGLFEAAVLSGLLPSFAFASALALALALRANNEEFRCHPTLLKASSPTERPQPSQSVNMF